MQEEQPSALIYVGDPMCSWCWGFAPTLGRLRKTFGGSIPTLLLLGGLRADEQARPLDDELAGFLERSWAQVASASGQAFRTDLLSRRDFRYDTGPACRAVILARTLGTGREFEYYDRIQAAFYLRNEDVTDTTVLSGIAASLGFDRAEFAAGLLDDDLVRKARDEFAMVRRHGVQGFPSLLVQRGGELQCVTRGFASFETVEAALREAGLG